MRDDLKNFEISTQEINGYAGKDVSNTQLSQEKYESVWQQKYAKHLQTKLEENGVKSWFESITVVKKGSWWSGDKQVPLSLNLIKITRSEKEIDDYLDFLIEKIIASKTTYKTNNYLYYFRITFLIPPLVILIIFLITFLIDSFLFNFDSDESLYGFAIFISIIISTILIGTFSHVIPKKERLKIDRISKKYKIKIKASKNEAIKEVNSYIIQYKEEYNKNNAMPLTLAALIEEVKRYNQVVEELVYNINVIDQLEDVGEAVSIQDRDKVLEAFRSMKTDLIRALKVERILRENPRFKPELFSINFAPLQDLKLSQQVANCEQLVNDALQIGVKVQKTMRGIAKGILQQQPNVNIDL